MVDPLDRGWTPRTSLAAGSGRRGVECRRFGWQKRKSQILVSLVSGRQSCGLCFDAWAFSSIYRKAWGGSGSAEQLFQYTPGASMVLTDRSADGTLLTFHDGCAGVSHVVPLCGDQDALGRKASDWLRDDYSVAQARFSPDSRFMAYRSNEFKTSDEIDAGIFEVYARPFDASKPEAGAGGAKPVQVSKAGALGMIFWRQDGKQMYFLTPEWEVMAVDVTTTPAFQVGRPRLLFKLPGPLVGDPQQWRNVSRDGQRFVFAINVPANVTAR